MKTRNYIMLLMCGVLCSILLCGNSCTIGSNDYLSVTSTVWPNDRGWLIDGSVITKKLYQDQNIRGDGVALAFPVITVANGLYQYCAYIIYRISSDGVKFLDYAAYDFECDTTGEGGLTPTRTFNRASLTTDTHPSLKFLNHFDGNQTWDGFPNPGESMTVDMKVFNYEALVASSNPEITVSSNIEAVLEVLNEKTQQVSNAGELTRRFSGTFQLERKE